MTNTMKRKILPFFTLGAGALGVGLRIWLYATGVDEKGLIISSHPANTLVLVLAALTLAGILLLTRAVGPVPAYSKLFPISIPAFIGNLAAAIGIVLIGATELLARSDSITLLSFLLGLLAAGSLVYLGWCRLRGIHPSVLFHAAVTVYLAVHIVSQYRFWGTEPQLQEYFFQLMASVFLVLTAYHRTALDAGSGSRKWYVFSNQAALFFCLTSSTGESGLFYTAMAVWAAANLCSLRTARQRRLPDAMHLPVPVQLCIHALAEAGFQAYAVGGCVRDSILGRVPNDYDLCTDASPEQICQVFSDYQLVRSGEKHGTIGVVLEEQVYEITTFRTEGSYSDGRHPDWVKFVPTVDEDLGRRDFTVNAMAYAPAKGYIDPWGGQNDLKAHILRAVGEPEARFREDALRILRGVRFAVRYGLAPEEETEKAMVSLAPLMDNLARERVFDELCKLLPLVTAEDLLRFHPIITQVIPELAPAVGFAQHNPNHVYDVYTHTAHVVEAVPQSLPLRWAALLHDIGKVSTLTMGEDGIGHFYGHAQAGAEAANKVLLRLRAPTALREQVVFLIAHHFDRLVPDKKQLRHLLGQYGTERVYELLTLQRCDVSSKGTQQNTEAFSQVEALLEEILQENPCLTAKDLAVNGRDILALGIEPGPKVGACMTFLLGQVQDEVLENTKQALLEAAKHYFAD